MPDSPRLKAEPFVQRIFSKSNVFGSLMLGALVTGAHWLLIRLPDREQRPAAHSAILFTPVAIGAGSARPLRVAGAWRVTSSDGRLGGVSALAVDRGGLLAVTDSGVTIRLPMPKRGRQFAEFRDLPDGPGAASFKAGRDSESLARDSGGRGWWVGFENRHAAWLFDSEMERVERRFSLKAMGWRANKGAEGAVSTARGLLLFPEAGNEVVRFSGRSVDRIALGNVHGRLADAALLPNGRIMVLARNFSPAGFSARLLLLEGRSLSTVAILRLGRLDNPEAIAVEPLPRGATRLWVMTDNDFRWRVPTLLIALDWPG